MSNPIFTDSFLSNVMKSAAVAGAISIMGICANAIMATHDQGRVLSWHTDAIKQLQVGQGAENKTLTDVDVSVVRLEGKIDTLNQKIDDAQKHEVTYQPEPPEPHHWVASK